MITKERLEELIEQGATIYEVDAFGVNAITLKQGDYVEEKGGVLHTQVVVGGYNYFYDERLFETKEEAEWHAEFGCIERTERLELPTWEELQNESEKNGCYGCEIFFMGLDEEKEPMQYVLDVRPDDKIYIGFAKEIGAKVLDIEFEAEYTKESYTLACRKCKQLFLGENE